MPEDLPKRPDLLIVSDTAVYKNEKDELLAFEPVVREIESFAHLFGSVTWIAYNYSFSTEIRNVRQVKGIDLHYILFPAVGGSNFFQRIKLIWSYFKLIIFIPHYIRKSDVIHTRGPSHPALITVCYSILFCRDKIFWHKYAGNWVRENDPFSYRLNKFLIKKARKTKVTINGNWPDQPDHILSFENPCLTEKERTDGLSAVDSKSFDGKLDFVFAGQMVETKGILKIIEAFRQLGNETRIGLLHFIGDGPDRLKYEELADKIRLNCVFHGFKPKVEVNKILSVSHVLLLPSESEGFPKVVAEGANFGCIPIVSDISCLSQYIRDSNNGFIMPTLDTDGLSYCIKKLLALPGKDLKLMAQKAYEMGEHFTYDYYNLRITRDILSQA